MVRRIFLCGTKSGNSIVLGWFFVTETVNSLHILMPKGLLFYLSNTLQGGVRSSWTLDSCRAPVLQILWGGQIARRRRDHLDPCGSRRPRIQGMTQAACFDMIRVVTHGEKRCCTDPAVLSPEEQAVRSPSPQGRGADVPASLLWCGCRAPETLTDECRLSNCIQIFLPISKKTPNQDGKYRDWTWGTKLLACQCFGCI